ncbi:MAG: undecaprenyl-phosphate glucose phosphotransferase [Nitrospirae bacterium]|nr:undecaprenyl-phosphate glucose phosphotransferase [Candidatus Troglogloeales bacterium]MBI3598146.1 undecaprenyl-phosphate glucose phosphotransferase [Candidatus Troglogloeales bacterium]
MLKRHREFYRSILLLIDFGLISIGWVSAYFLRFYTDLIPVTKGVPVFTTYLALFPAVLLAWVIAFKSFNLFRPQRIASRLSEVWDVTKGCGFMTILLVAISFFLRQFEYSRAVFIVFGVHCVILVSMSRWAFRATLRLIRQKGYNIHGALIIGAGRLGRELAGKLHYHSELGVKVIGYLTRKPEKVGQALDGIKVLGVYSDLPDLFTKYSIDQVFIALPQDSYTQLPKIVAFLQEQTVDVRIVPDIVSFMTLQGQAELFDGLPIVTLQATPLYGWGRLAKRVMDILLSSVILLILSPLLFLIGVAILLVSGRPIFYQQKRMGYDGQVFEMMKFRTMLANAEEKTGVVWTVQNDPRRTPLGAFLRATSLDELPQFLNVMKGEMSIVGPRPERPEFVEQFKQKVPKYMLRHKIKAGITGLAQIRGWRGNTSLDERIKCDLEYIERWSPLLDLKIMVLTLWRGFLHKNAY